MDVFEHGADTRVHASRHEQLWCLFLGQGSVDTAMSYYGAGVMNVAVGSSVLQCPTWLLHSRAGNRWDLLWDFACGMLHGLLGMVSNKEDRKTSVLERALYTSLDWPAL